jgi:hypothetical protein
LNNYQLRSAAWVQSQAYKLRHHKNCNFDFFYINYDAKKLKTKSKWREEWDNDELTKHDEEREQEAEEEGDEQERKGEKAADKKNGDKCGCCCHDGAGSHGSKSDRAKAGEPDDEDDIIEIHPRPPKRPVIIGGGNKPQPPAPKPPAPKPPTQKPVPPKEPGPGELNKEWGFYVERPFYLTSMCGQKRFMDIIGNNLDAVVKTPNEFDT